MELPAQDPDYDGQQTILDHLYASDMAAVKAMRIYAAAADGDDDEALQAAYEGMDLHNAWDFEARAKEVLGRLNLHNLGRTMATLSGGERRRIALARVLIEEPDILFLDEPTNHLDLDMIQWLERYLAQSKMTILMITHDRYFLENVCDTILELDDQTLYKYKGNYSYYLEKGGAQGERIGQSRQGPGHFQARTRMDAVHPIRANRQIQIAHRTVLRNQESGQKAVGGRRHGLALESPSPRRQNHRIAQSGTRF